MLPLMMISFGLAYYSEKYVSLLYLKLLQSSKGVLHMIDIARDCLT
jgi:hypothetical protein